MEHANLFSLLSDAADGASMDTITSAFDWLMRNDVQVCAYSQMSLARSLGIVLLSFPRTWHRWKCTTWQRTRWRVKCLSWLAEPSASVAAGRWWRWRPLTSGLTGASAVWQGRDLPLRFLVQVVGRRSDGSPKAHGAQASAGATADRLDVQSCQGELG